MSIRKPRTYQTAPPGRPGRGSARRSPGRLSRGFNPEVGIVLVAYSSLLTFHFRLFTAEGQAIVSHVDRYVIAFAELAFEHPHRQRIEDTALDGALQRPRAVHRIVAFRHEERLGRLAQVDVDLPFLETLEQAADLDVDDRLHVLQAERVEEDDFVDAVEELRP